MAHVVMPIYFPKYCAGLKGQPDLSNSRTWKRNGGGNSRDTLYMFLLQPAFSSLCTERRWEKEQRENWKWKRTSDYHYLVCHFFYFFAKSSKKKQETRSWKSRDKRHVKTALIIAVCLYLIFPWFQRHLFPSKRSEQKSTEDKLVHYVNILFFQNVKITDTRGLNCNLKAFSFSSLSACLMH